MSDRGRWRPLVARRFAGGLLIGVLTGLAATGCSGDPPDDPVTLPPATTTPSPSATSTEPTPTPTETAPTPSTTLTLTGDNVESVEKFVHEFFDAYNEAKESRDLSVFEATYLPQCDQCIAMRDELAGWLAGGQTVEGGDWHVIQTISTAFPDGGRGDFTALVYRDPVTVPNPGMTQDVAGPAVAIRLVNGVLRPGGGPWLAEGVSFKDPPK